MTTLEDLGWTRVVVPKKKILEGSIFITNIINFPTGWDYFHMSRDTYEDFLRSTQLLSDNRKLYTKLWGKQDWCHVGHVRHHNWGWTNGSMTILVDVSKRGSQYSLVFPAGKRTPEGKLTWDEAVAHYAEHEQDITKFLKDLSAVIQKNTNKENT